MISNLIRDHKASMRANIELLEAVRAHALSHDYGDGKPSGSAADETLWEAADKISEKMVEEMKG